MPRVGRQRRLTPALRRCARAETGTAQFAGGHPSTLGAGHAGTGDRPRRACTRDPPAARPAHRAVPQAHGPRCRPDRTRHRARLPHDRGAGRRLRDDRLDHREAAPVARGWERPCGAGRRRNRAAVVDNVAGRRRSLLRRASASVAAHGSPVTAAVRRDAPELAGIDVATMRGLEIGPLASPRVRKSEGPIRYLDHASAAELKQKYETDLGMRDRLDEIVDVDSVIGDKQTTSGAVMQEAPFDYVIACHVIEHIPDPIDWMDDIARILRPGGILSLVIPHKRYCLGINRSLTEISDLVDANLRHLRQPSFRQVYDFNSKALLDLVDTQAVWKGDADYSAATRQGVGDPDHFALEAC